MSFSWSTHLEACVTGNNFSKYETLLIYNFYDSCFPNVTPTVCALWPMSIFQFNSVIELNEYFLHIVQKRVGDGVDGLKRAYKQGIEGRTFRGTGEKGLGKWLVFEDRCQESKWTAVRMSLLWSFGRGLRNTESQICLPFWGPQGKHLLCGRRERE